MHHALPTPRVASKYGCEVFMKNAVEFLFLVTVYEECNLVLFLVTVSKFSPYYYQFTFKITLYLSFFFYTENGGVADSGQVELTTTEGIYSGTSEQGTLWG